MEEDVSQDVVAQTHAKILVIDDHESARNLLKRRLSIYGHEVYTSATEKEAMDTLKQHPVDVIFLNMFISGQSSYDFLVTLKDDKEYKNIPVIMISSDNDVDLVVKCIEGGAEDYMVKPLNQTILRARLANCIAKKEAHDREMQFMNKIAQGQKQLAAQEKMVSLGTLVSSISHELRNPLNFVINFAQVCHEQCREIATEIDGMKNKISPELYEAIVGYMKKFDNNVSKIAEYGRSADRIIRFMFDQSNTSKGQKSPADINKIIQQTITMFNSSYKSNGCTRIPKIETKFDTKIPHVNLSIQAISRAIYNIFDNAAYSVLRKYEKLGDCKIIISTEDIGDSIKISIYDNGSGISDDIIDKVFNPFFTTKQEENRPGLGLSSTKEVIDKSGGTISVQSVPGESAEFTITLKKVE